MGIASKHLVKDVHPIKKGLDPRPDLIEDHALWELLLANAAKVNHELFVTLDGFRCGGTRIKKGKKVWYVLRPDIDSTGNLAWKSQSEYEEARDIYLKPHLDDLIVLLKQLKKEAA